MNSDKHVADIERMAREAGILEPLGFDNPDMKAWRDDVIFRLTRFAALVRAQALEDAARVAENTATCLLPTGSFLSERCAAAIRALGDTK